MEKFCNLVKIGNGAFSTVYKAIKKSDRQIYAIKMVCYFYKLGENG